MVDPERNPLSGLVEIDEASLPFRTKDDPSYRRTLTQPRRQDAHRSAAIELGDVNIPGRLRLAEISCYEAAADLGHFVETAADPVFITRKPTAGPNLLRSPPIATMCMSSEDRRSPRPAVDPPNLLQPQRMGARRLPRAASQASAGLVPDDVQGFASTAAKPTTLLSDRSSASPPMPAPRYLQHFDRTGAMCISGSRDYLSGDRNLQIS